MGLGQLRVVDEIRSSHVTIQLRDYLWPTPTDGDVDVEVEPTLVLNVSPPPPVGVGRHKINPFANSFERLGSLVFHPPKTPMHSRGSGGRLRVITCSYSASRFEEVTGIVDWDADRLRACFDIRGDQMEAVLKRLAREAASPGFASGILVESMATSLMVELSRYFYQTVARSASRTGKLADWQLRKLNEYLDALDNHSPTVTELAQLFGVSNDHFGRAFKRTTGQSIMSHVEHVRLGKAKQLLTDTDLPLKEISHRLGFPSQSGFSIAFRRATGEAPARFRQLLKSSGR